MLSLRSERVYLAYGQPRPSSHFVALSLRYGPPDSPPFCKRILENSTNSRPMRSQ